MEEGRRKGNKKGEEEGKGEARGKGKRRRLGGEVGICSLRGNESESWKLAVPDLGSWQLLTGLPPGLWLQHSEGRPWSPDMSSIMLGSASPTPVPIHQVQPNLPPRLPTEPASSQHPPRSLVQGDSSTMRKDVNPCWKSPGTGSSPQNILFLDTRTRDLLIFFQEVTHLVGGPV